MGWGETGNDGLGRAGCDRVIDREHVTLIEFAKCTLSLTGAIFQGSLTISNGSSVLDSVGQQLAGGFFIVYGELTLSDSYMYRSMSHTAGGACHNTIGTLRILRSWVVNSTAPTGGAVSMECEGARVLIDNSTLVNSSSTGISSPYWYGGALHVWGGDLLITNGSSLVNSHSETNGGAISMLTGSCTISSSSIVSSYARESGGALVVVGGALFMVDSSVVRSSASHYGGAIITFFVGAITLQRCSIFMSNSGWGGGAASTFDLGVIVITDSIIVNSTAATYGGFMCISSGTARVITSRVARSHSIQAGGFLNLITGSMHLTYSIIEDSTNSALSFGHILNVMETADGGLILLTSSEFRQANCDGALFSALRRAQIVLRNFTLTPLAGCSPAALASAHAFVLSGPTKGCSDTYEDPAQPNQEKYPMCSSASPGGCIAHPVAGTALTSLSCSCPFPEFINPAAAQLVNDQTSGVGTLAFAPYLPSTGCIAPMRLTDVTIITRTVVVALSKPAVNGPDAMASMEHSLNISLYIQGTDVHRPARWRVMNVSLLQARSTWLQLPAVAGETDVQAISKSYPSPTEVRPIA